MLFFENDEKLTLEERIQKGLELFEKREGKKPTKCVINPKMTLDRDIPVIEDIEIEQSRTILSNHFWITAE